MAQKNGELPTMFASGSAPGESGVSVFGMQFRGSAHFNATPRQHLVWFQMSPQVPIDCRIAGRRLRHELPSGGLAICPAGCDSAADAEGHVDAIVVAIEPGRLALAAAESEALEAQLTERLSGQDQELLHLAHALALENSHGYPNGPFFWNEAASGFINGLVARYTSGVNGRVRGALGQTVLERLRDFVLAHLSEPINVEELAKIAGRSPFHFSRVFTRSVGITPHRYIVHLRLQRALALVQTGRAGLAEAAAQTGFADQSHLSRWVRRVYGVSPKQLMV